MSSHFALLTSRISAIFSSIEIDSSFFIVSARFSINNLENGVADMSKPEEVFMDTGDISNETKRTLNFMGLDRWFTLGQYVRISKDEY